MDWLVNPTTGDIYTEDTTQDNIVKALEKPYPSGMWYVSDTPDVTHDDAITDIYELGAFINNPNLTELIIPESVKSIGPFACSGTGLTEVTLADDCTYYSTSFPPGCVVTGGQIIN